MNDKPAKLTKKGLKIPGISGYFGKGHTPVPLAPSKELCIYCKSSGLTECDYSDSCSSVEPTPPAPAAPEVAEELRKRLAERLRKACHGTYNGGHHDEPAHGAFHHGMDTVCNVLAAEGWFEAYAASRVQGLEERLAKQEIVLKQCIKYVPNVLKARIEDALTENSK